MMHRQSSLLDFAKIGCNEDPEKDSDTRSTDVSDNEVEPANTESASIITQATNLPGDIAQSKAQSPVQPILSSYPQTVFGKGKNARNRSFNHYWYTLFPFIEYSASRNAVFYFPCQFFPNPTISTEQVFTSVGFRGWKSIRTALEKHQNGGSHTASMTYWASFRQTKYTGSIADQLDSHRRTTILENRKYLKTMLKIALLCARQEIALTGHDESDKSDNKGIFREILSLLLSENPSLQQQFDSAPSNAKYHSKEIQNDLHEAAIAVVLHNVCQDVQCAHYFSVIADECCDNWKNGTVITVSQICEQARQLYKRDLWGLLMSKFETQ